jgi:hypothetical protein
MMRNLKKRASSHDDHFLKILFTLSRCRIAEDNGSGDLLSRSQMHIDERDKVVTGKTCLGLHCPVIY